MKNKIILSLLFLIAAAPTARAAPLKIWITATPDPLIVDPTLPKRPLAKITVHVKNSGKAKIKLTALVTNVGQISKAKASKAGGWFAAYEPAKLAFPTVAMIRADFEVDGKLVRRWVSVPVAIKLKLPVATKGAVDISVSVAGQDFAGPTPKKRQKQVSVQVIITPGAGNYTINRVTEQGVTSAETQRFSLPPFPRMVIVGPKKPTAGSVIRLDVFHVGGKGKIYTYNVPLVVDCKVGKIKGSRGQRSEQSFWIKLGGETGPTRIRVALKQDQKVAGFHHMNVELARTLRLIVSVQPKRLTMSGTRSVKVLVRVTDTFGNTARTPTMKVSSNGLPITSMARIEPGLWRGWLYAPSKRQPKDRLLVRATAPRAHSGSAQVVLLGGSARKLTIRAARQKIQADGTRGVNVVITAVDHLGMAPRDRTIKVTSKQGKMAYLHRVRSGLFRGKFVPNKTPGGGFATITASTLRAPAVSTKIELLPIPQRFMFSSSLGAFTDVGRTLGIQAGFRFEYAAYKGRPAVHIGFEVLLSPHFAAVASKEQDEYFGFSAGLVALARLRMVSTTKFGLDGVVDVGVLGIFASWKTFNDPVVDPHQKGTAAFTVSVGLEAGLVTVAQNELFFLLRFRYLTGSLVDAQGENHITILGGIGYRFEL